VTAAAQETARNLLDRLHEPEVQTELNLSATQVEQIVKIRESLNDRSGLAELMKKSTQVTSEEERAQLREQMHNFAATRRQQAEEQLKSVLSAEQLTKAEQIGLQRRGLRALADQDVAEQLGLSDEQEQSLAALSSQRNTARAEAELLTPEQVSQFDSQWDARYAAVLTDEQKQQWTSLSGLPLPGAAGTTLAAQPTAQGTPATGSDAAGEGDVVASFGRPRRGASSEPRDPDKLYFNLQNAPWSEVLPLFAEAAGLTLDLHTIPPGSFSHIDDKGYTITEALDVI